MKSPSIPPADAHPHRSPHPGWRRRTPARRAVLFVSSVRTLAGAVRTAHLGVWGVRGVCGLAVRTCWEPLWNLRGWPAMTNDDQRQPEECWSGEGNPRLTRFEKRAVETQGKKK